MFGIGTGELLIILVIALLIIGPNKLPELARVLGKGMSEFKKAADDLKDSVRTEIHVEEEKQKLLDIHPQQKESEPNKQENSPQAKPLEEKGNIIKDAEEKKDLL